MKSSLKPILFFATFVAIVSSVPHDYHVGIHHIRYSADSKTFECTHKVFVDDLESALRLSGFAVKLEDSLDKPEIKKALSTYFARHFVLTVDGNAIPMNFLGTKWEDYHTLYIFRETLEVKNPDQIELKDDLFMEVNEDQQHMHYFQHEGKEAGLPTMKGKEKVFLTFPLPD